MTGLQTEPVLKIRNLVKTKGDPLTASFTLEIPELTVNPGEIVAILGESGCGKSTLMDLVAMVSSPDQCDELKISARTSAQGCDVLTLPSASYEASHAGTRSHIGYIPQAEALLPFLSIWENAALPSQIFGRRVPASRIVSIAARLGIGNKLDLLPKHLSSGQRHRAEILRAFAHQPTLVLADELPAGIAPLKSLRMVQEMKNLVSDHSEAAIFAATSLELVEDIADRVYTFHRSSDASGNHIKSVCYRNTSPAKFGPSDQARAGSELVH